MSKQELFEQIDAYLQGELTEAERAAFEARLQSDQELADQVRLFREMSDALSDKPTVDFQNTVAAEGAAFLAKDKSEDTETAVVRSIGWSRRSLSIAASILVIVVSTFILWNVLVDTPQSGKELFAQYFESYDLNQSIRSNTVAGDSVFNLAIQQYQSGDYVKAATIFKQLTTSEDQNMVLVFCLANTYLSQEAPEIDLAAQQFQTIIEDGNSIYVPRAKWYRALIHLQKEEIEAAKSLLEDIAKSSDKFGEQAKSMLEDL